MDAFAWDERYTTGETIVDEEHQELVRLINMVVEKVSRDTPVAEVTAILDQLVSYAAVHFAHEECLMVEVGCDPRFVDKHTAVHQEFARQVIGMRGLAGKDMGTEDLLRFLTSWLAHHILGMDQSMARQIRAIRAGESAEAIYRAESAQASDPATASLLTAMGSLYRVIAARNDSLQRLNEGLESTVEARTKDLVFEREQLKQAMNQLAVTQKKLFESEHKRHEAAKRNMEAFLAQIIDGDPVPTFVIDASHRITHWNQACVRLSGVPTHEVVGTHAPWKVCYPAERPTLADLIIDGDAAQFSLHYGDSVRPSPTVDGAFEAEQFFPRLGESGRWLFFTAAPLRDSNGKIIGAIETLQDVTERRQAEEGLRQYQNQLEALVEQRTAQLAAANVELEAERLELEQLLARVEEAQQQLLQAEKMAAIGQLAAGVAHEINNPVGFVNSNLGTLKNYAGQLLDLVSAYETGDPVEIARIRQQADIDFLREDLPSLLSESQEGLTRVTKIVQDLKDFSHVDQSERQPADLNAALESTLNVVWNEIKYKAEVIRELGDIPEVDCVPAQINQVFMNLLINAAQAIPAQGKIFVRSGVEGPCVWFEIEDTGQGMSDEVRQRIFEPFFTTKPVGKGTGLGLSISYDIIVKKHQGRMEVRSTPGAGSTFRLWLPIAGPAD